MGKAKGKQVVRITGSYISANPEGFIKVQDDGFVRICAGLELNSPYVAAPDWTAETILALEPEAVLCSADSQWEIRRVGDSLQFNMVGNSTRNWGGPHRMSIPRAELEERVGMLKRAQ